MVKIKKIEDVVIEIKDLRYDFGNPRKTNRAKQEIEELKNSIEQFGSWRSIGIDENNNVIFGNKLSIALKELGIKQTSAKRLIGYSQSELKAINIKDNKHVGEFDNLLLNKWIEEIKIDIPNLDLIIQENIKPIKTENFQYYKSIYFFIECKDIDQYDQIKEELASIKQKGILIEQSAN